MKTIFNLLTISIILSGCDTLVEESDSYDYSIEQQMGCYCPQSGIWVKLFVKADTISNAIRISDNYHLDYNEFKYYNSIKGLFNEISQRDTVSYEVKVIMDSINNFPSYIYFNPKPIIYGDTLLVISDGQLSYTTKNYFKIH